MSNPTLTKSPAAAAKSERGLGYAVAGGLGITLLSVLLGAVYLAWFLSSTRTASPQALLPADTQLYLALAPTISDVPEAERITATLREQFGLVDMSAAADGAVRLLGVEYDSGILTWLGSTMAVAVRGVDPGEASAASLLRDGEVVFILGSRNDPQAEVFITKHLAARAARGETIVPMQQGELTIYAQQGGPPSPIAAFALFEHYLLFANKPEAILAMASYAGDEAGTLASVPAFQRFSAGLTERVAGGLYTVSEADPARLALRELLLNLGR